MMTGIWRLAISSNEESPSKSVLSEPNHLQPEPGMFS